MNISRTLLSDAVLLIDKSAGMTSFDVIAVLRKIIGQRRIGHAGTLDKSATGLLVVCTGRLTRLVHYLIEKDKEYTGTITLGITTDSDDREGEILERRPIDGISEQMIIDAVSSFQGEILQRPPVYSALKIEGKRASDRTRRGEVLEMKERPVTIHRISVKEINLPVGEVIIDVKCSKGTYIRSLARDIGEKLGCGGYLSALRRTRCGELSVDSALTLDDLRTVLESGETDRKFCVSGGEALSQMTRIVLDRTGIEKVKNGARFAPENIIFRGQNDTLRYAIDDEDKNLIAIADVDIDNWSINYLNVFN
ncbi:MAG TPA: tRNA pseudouridine(55) synthase TruB [Spirochaetota bacterium]